MSSITKVAMMVTPREGGLRGEFRELVDSDAVTMGGAVAALFAVETPDAVDTNDIVVSKAGNAASNGMTIAKQPDVPRNLQVAFGATWDGGDVTVVGTNQFDETITEVFAADPGNTVVGSKVFKTITSASKGAVGADAATASIGSGGKLGTNKPLANTVGLVFTDAVAEAATIDPLYSSFEPTTPPSGTESYILLASI